MRGRRVYIRKGYRDGMRRVVDAMVSGSRPGRVVILKVSVTGN